ncbi:MAG: bile acid:sodium symporter family protein [Alcanivorax sp.]|jgi:BASS family bile acid:Na+ symporter|nr:MAG: Na+-dependent transporter [Oceanobacter sp.]|tara:strand:- start:886 stop:1752 length:867 start_codon:yes stop_codon:yes gene_type:complete
MFQALTQIALPISLILIMTGVGMGLKIADFRRVVAQPKAFLIGAICQMAILPLIAVAIIELTGLTGPLAIGLFILALCPGGTTSNLYTLLARGDVGLSVSLTAVIGFITPFTIPILGAWAIANYATAEQAIVFPVLKTWITLIVVTVIPVIIGMLLRAKWESLALRLEPWVSKFSIAVLALVIVVICVNLGEKLIDFALLAGPAALLLNLVTMSLGYVAGSLLLHHEDQARTISLEVGLQNGTLALMITTGILQNAEMSVAPSVYSLLMFITATLFTVWVRKRPLTSA